MDKHQMCKPMLFSHHDSRKSAEVYSGTLEGRKASTNVSGSRTETRYEVYPRLLKAFLRSRGSGKVGPPKQVEEPRHENHI